eukprot:gnl/TRDRNA2_/TRDRNA2_28381_c1_seq1.p1 gnl/TRDRNA2_/TRDRNA2_28381_c1~~gnl/TRDRNA2_/TRDRNA2_28381_c1_seq1.p1  ORF type:complete len:547 (+),score=98.19 gnl/TRDRNA2_/TRDRNA2_28381_c1_seq1:1-1641(+)
MPKLRAIATAVARRREKAAVLVSRQGGYMAMLAIMQQAAAESVPPFAVATGERLAEFNAVGNTRGEDLLVLVADSAEFSEGVSFHAVRRLYLAEVPLSASTFQQQCGRVARMFGHHALPLEERSVAVVLPISVSPPWMHGSQLGAWAFRTYCKLSSRPKDVVQNAHGLLGKLRASAVMSLQDLKRTVDDAANNGRSATHHDDPLSNETLVRLFKSWSLWDTTTAVASKRRARPSAPPVAGETSATVAAGLKSRRLRPLVRALRELHRVADAEDVASTLATATADEAVLASLSAQLVAQAPALESLRRSAIDCGSCDGQQETEGDCGHDEELSDWDPPFLARQAEQAKSCDGSGSKATARMASRGRQKVKPALSGLFDNPGRAMRCFQDMRLEALTAAVEGKPETSAVVAARQVLSNGESSAAKDAGSAAPATGSLAGLPTLPQASDAKVSLPSSAKVVRSGRSNFDEEWIAALDAALGSPARNDDRALRPVDGSVDEDDHERQVASSAVDSAAAIAPPPLKRRRFKAPAGGGGGVGAENGGFAAID